MKKIAKFIYYYMSASLLLAGAVVKFFLTDTNLGEHIKDFNYRLLVSDLIFLYAIFLLLIGLFFYAIRKKQRNNLKDSVVIISAVLLIPIAMVLVLTPILETIYPGEVGESALTPWVAGLSILSVFSILVWLLLFIGILIMQVVKLMTIKR